MRSLRTLLIVLLSLFAASCADDASLLQAAERLEVPSAFQETEAETNNSFEAITRSLSFTTQLSQNDACELARETLASWADQALPEPRSALPRNICSYELANPTNHDAVDLAVARVFRAKVDDEFIEDDAAAGGVESITIFFRTDK